MKTPETVTLSNTQKTKDHITNNLLLLKHDFPKKSKAIGAYYHYFLAKEFDNEEQIYQNFVWFLDMFFINQITDQFEYDKLQDKIFACSLYGRDRNFENMTDRYRYGEDIIVSESIKHISNWITPETFLTLKNHPNYEIHYLSDISQKSLLSRSYLSTQFSDKLQVFVLISEVSWEELEHMFDFTFPKKFLIIAKESITSDISRHIYISNLWGQDFAEGYWEIISLLSEHEHSGNPLQFPDIQTVIVSRLKAGLSIYGRPLEDIWEVKIRKYTKHQVENILQKTYSNRAKKTLRLKTEITSEKQQELLQGHIAHYEKFFYDEMMGLPEVFLTNSWVWANNTIISLLWEYVPNIRNWYEHDFYRENVGDLKWKTLLTGTTQVFLASPSILHPYAGETQASFQADLKQKLLRFLENAHFHPKKPFFLVVDVTTNLNLDLQEFLGEYIPKNLMIIKTFSLTKHQRGDTNYFLGGMALYGKLTHNFWEEVQEHLGSKWYELNAHQTIAYPRLRHSEIQKNLENINANRAAFKKWFLDGMQEKKMTAIMPELIDSEYFTFLLVPLPRILKFYQEGKFSSQSITDIHDGATHLIQRGAIIENHPIAKWEIIPSFVYIEYLQDLKLTLKDTFWLRYNNLNSNFLPYSNVFFKELNGEFKLIEIPRIAFWFQKDEAGSQHIGKVFADMYESYMYNILRSKDEEHQKTDV